MTTFTKALCFIALFFSFFSNGQCDLIETITICDMTQIDNDNDGVPDGIINLYNEYFNLTGNTIQQGSWFDPGFNFAINQATGDLSLWDLDNASEAVTDYQFQLTNTSCGADIALTLNVVIGPFSGDAVPAIATNDVNVEICDSGDDPCGSSTFFDLYQTLLSNPSPHLNGIWSYEGTSPNFIAITDNKNFIADVPYQPGIPLVDEETFELLYTVPGITPCDPVMETRVKVSVVREVRSGSGNEYNICETELIAGDFNVIDLRDDAFLVGEDEEGIWLFESDTTGQLSGPGDSQINLGEVYNDLYTVNPRFGCQTYSYSYYVESRSAICPDKTSAVSFTFFEYLRPFQQNVPAPEFCIDDESLSTFNLYSLLDFTTENGVLYDYPDPTCTNWSLVSGPSNLGLISNMGDLCSITEDPNYTTLGTLDLSNLTNADAGTYVFEYFILPEYNCEVIDSEKIYDSPDGCNFEEDVFHPCQQQSAQVTIIIYPFLYAGEDTGILEFCEEDIVAPINLISLLETNGVDGPVYEGVQGTWIDLDTGNAITNPFVLPQINNQATFNFNYTTINNNCEDTANLSFTVYEQYQSGTGSTIEVCSDDSSFNLFNTLTGNPNTNGTWSGPNGFISADNNVIFEPSTFNSGDYIYTVPDNNLCPVNSTIVTVSIGANANAGDNILETICKLDNATLDLFTVLDPDATPGGVFVDLNSTNSLNGSTLDISQLSAGTYNFEYQIQGAPICSIATSQITITVIEVDPPAVTNQTFCISDGATLNDIQVSNAIDYNWYESEITDTVLELDTVLANNEDYFIAAVDANGCESNRVQLLVTLLPFGSQDCEDCISDGVSANNDTQNEDLDLCNLPEVFPNYEITIFSRYGTTVFIGNNNTPLFNGSSNMPLTIGNKLPSGVYFYIFNPKDNVTAPFQGNFYLSR